MCSIIYLKPNAMIPYEMLENAVYNNWHSYGLVTKVDGKLDIKKKVPESGEVDPKEVFKLLQDDIEYERFLHLRHNTAGIRRQSTRPRQSIGRMTSVRHGRSSLTLVTPRRLGLVLKTFSVILRQSSFKTIGL